MTTPMPTNAPLPFMPAGVRAFLTGQTQYTALCSHTTTRELPQSLTGPCVTIRTPVNPGGDPMKRMPLIQLDAWTPNLELLGGTVDPEEVSWDVAAMAGQLLGRARNVEFRGTAWSGNWIEGPVMFVDTTRGVDFPLYRSMIRVELKVRAPRD